MLPRLGRVGVGDDVLVPLNLPATGIAHKRSVTDRNERVQIVANKEAESSEVRDAGGDGQRDAFRGVKLRVKSRDVVIP